MQVTSNIRLLVLAAGVALCGGWADDARAQAKDGLKDSPMSVRGAGATFPAPLYKKWIATYKTSHPNVLISYDVVGSGEGVKRFLAKSVDFAGSDEVLSESDAASVAGGVVTVPTTAGLIALAYNLPGLSGELKLPRDVYTGIFAGAIRRWNDPRIAAANPTLRLPARDIALVARLDSSGTTSAFTRHLAAADPAWRSKGLGAGKLIAWPSHTMLASGNEGVASRIKISQDSIGYVEYGFAKRLGLPMAVLENKSGTFVAPSEAAGQLALSARVVETDLLDKSVIDPTAVGAYPIVSYSWLLLYRTPREAAKAKELHTFVAWALVDGQKFGPEFGYVPLSADVVSLGRQALESISGN